MCVRACMQRGAMAHGAWGVWGLRRRYSARDPNECQLVPRKEIPFYQIPNTQDKRERFIPKDKDLGALGQNMQNKQNKKKSNANAMRG